MMRSPLSRNDHKLINSFLRRRRSPVVIPGRGAPSHRKDRKEASPSRGGDELKHRSKQMDTTAGKRQVLCKKASSTRGPSPGSRVSCVPLTMTDNGFYTCTVYINGVRGCFLLDTGSNGTCIDSKSKGRFKTAVTSQNAAATASHTVKIERTQNNTIRIGKSKLDNFEIDLLCLDQVKGSVHSGVDGILGNRALKSVDAVIEYASNSLLV